MDDKARIGELHTRLSSWLLDAAYPLWSTDRLAGSPAEERTYAFLWVVLPIIAMPWKYAFDHYVRGRAKLAGRQPA